MQNTDLSNTKTFDFEVFKKSALPSKEQFHEIASNKALLANRPMWVSVLLRVLLAAILSINVPIHWVLIWLTLSLLANFSIKRRSVEFAQLLTENPQSMTEHMKLKVKTYKNVWLVNGLLWGLASVLAQIWLSDLHRILTYTILTAAIYLFLTRNCADKKLMNQVSSLILGIPFIAAFVRAKRVGRQA